VSALSFLVRNLIVFTSYLDSTVQPEHANYPLFHGASKLFSDVVDEILEAKFGNAETIGASNLDVLVNAAVVDFGSERWDSIIDNANYDQLGFLETMDMGIMLDQRLVRVDQRRTKLLRDEKALVALQ
jgi:hypothetical protein